MRFGAITNSFRLQLAEQSVASLVEQAIARGAKHVELRQTCLGECETGEGKDWRPVLPNLRTLVGGFPAVSFNLAMALPCLTKASDPGGEQFQAALEAAKLVGRGAPHLRLVDPARFEGAWDVPGKLPEEALGVTDLAREAASHGVTLSIENSGQPIRAMTMLVREARSRLTDSEGAYLGLCPDPVNQLRGFPDADALAELDAVPLDMLKIVHFKQTRGGDAHPTLDTGDLDCARMVRILEAKGYRGAAIMEIPPHEDVFDNLSASFAFLGGVFAEG